MKFRFYLLLVFCIGSLYFTIIPQNTIHSNRIKDPDIFVSDSGYILHKQAINLLRKVDDTATIKRIYKETDTVGSYFKTLNGNYLYSIINLHTDFGDSHILVESKPDSKIIQTQYYDGGNYSCCWDNNFEGFKRHGDYYSIKTCGTGSGFCSTETYFFKDLVSQDSQNSILTHMGAGWCIDKFSCSLLSDIEIKSDTIITHYILKKIKMGKRRNKVKKTEKFDVKYIQRESKWIALDSIKITNLPR